MLTQIVQRTWIAFAASMLSAVVPAATAAQATNGASNARKLEARQWAAMWQRGGAKDTLFGWIREHVASDQAVYVLDAGTLQVHAFALRDGKHLWSTGSKGGGPGQMLRPVDIALAPSGELAVLDPGNGRVSFFGAEGRFRRSVALADGAIASAFCVRDNSNMVLATTNAERAFIEVDAKGRFLRAHPFPWRDTDPGNGLVRSILPIRGTPTRDCGFATTFGFGLVLIQPDGRVTTRPYAVTAPLPTFRKERIKGDVYSTFLEKGTPAAHGAFRTRDAIFVTTYDAATGRFLVDSYDQHGVYRSSWPSPEASMLSYADRHVTALTTDGDVFRLRGWASTKDTAQLMREYRASIGPKTSLRGKSKGNAR